MISDNPESPDRYLDICESVYMWKKGKKGVFRVSAVILEHSSCDLTELLQLRLCDNMNEEVLAWWENERKVLTIADRGHKLGLLYDCILSASLLASLNPPNT